MSDKNLIDSIKKNQIGKMSLNLRMKYLSGESTKPLSYLLKVVIRIYSFKPHSVYSLLSVTRHTVLRNSTFKKGKDRE